MKKTIALLVLLSVTGASSQAHAVERYISGLAGISWMNQIDITDTNLSSDTTMKLKTEGGFTGVAAVGCDYGSTRA